MMAGGASPGLRGYCKSVQGSIFPGLFYSGFSLFSGTSIYSAAKTYGIFHFFLSLNAPTSHIQSVLPSNTFQFVLAALSLYHLHRSFLA